MLKPVERAKCGKGAFDMEGKEQGFDQKAQDQRKKAVDMMKHIAAAWNIQPEEVFGKEGAENDNV